MLSEYGTEQVGISAEIAIASLTGVTVDQAYKRRGRSDLIKHLTPSLAFAVGQIPTPIEHVAEGQNAVDFLLEGGKTLSVKSNMRELGKAAPQNIGQPTSATFWERLPFLVPDGVAINSLSYSESAKVFKQVAQSNTAALLAEYWKNLFDCDYLLYVYNVLGQDNELSASTQVLIYEKSESPQWDESKISFTRTLLEWNESCTVRYGEISIAEFQVHSHRNCFKFRFNLGGLIRAGLL